MLRRRVLDAVERDVEVAAGGGLIERRKGDLLEFRGPTQLLRDELRDLDVEAHDAPGIARVGFHVRRATFRIAGPAKRRQLLRVRTMSERKGGGEGSSERH